MRDYTYLFTINGKPMLVPDEEVGFNYEDLESSDSGRDESGIMHRVVVRYKVPSWSFSYSHLTEEEKLYMESLFTDEPTFQFGHPSRGNLPYVDRETTACYRSKYGISWKNARTGLWSGYSFDIIAC